MQMCCKCSQGRAALAKSRRPALGLNQWLDCPQPEIILSTIKSGCIQRWKMTLAAWFDSSDAAERLELKDGATRRAVGTQSVVGRQACA